MTVDRKAIKSSVVDDLIAIASSKEKIAVYSAQSGSNGSDSAVKEKQSVYLTTLLGYYDRIGPFIEGKGPTVQDAYERSRMTIKEAATSTEGLSPDQKNECCSFVQHVRPLLDDLNQRKPPATTAGMPPRSHGGP